MKHDEYIAALRKRLGDYRFNHSMEVAASARALAEKYGADAEKAYTAGILHDIMKEAPRGEHLQLLDEAGVLLTEVEKSSEKLWHAVSGACYVKKYFGLGDDITLAIRYHTTGRAGMTLLEKIIFIADFISADRVYDGVERMREKAQIGLEFAMLEGLQFTVAELVEGGSAVHPDTIDAYNEIVLK